MDTTADTQVAVPNRTHLSSQFVLTHRSSLCRIPRRRWILRWCPRPRIPRIRRTRIPRTALNGEQCERVISSEGTSRQRHCGQVPNCKKGCSCFFTHQRPKPPQFVPTKSDEMKTFQPGRSISQNKKRKHTNDLCKKRGFILFSLYETTTTIYILFCVYYFVYSSETVHCHCFICSVSKLLCVNNLRRFTPSYVFFTITPLLPLVYRFCTVQ